MLMKEESDGADLELFEYGADCYCWRFLFSWKFLNICLVTKWKKKEENIGGEVEKASCCHGDQIKMHFKSHKIAKTNGRESGFSGLSNMTLGECFPINFNI